MLRNIIIIALIAISYSVNQADAQAKDVSNSEIRDAILSLVHSYTLLDNKLERHEQRERALGELVKKGLLTLQKNQRIFDPLKGLIQRLDDRIGAIESKMLDQEEKIKDVLTDILSWMKKDEDNRNCNGGSDESDNSDVSKKLDSVSEDLKGLRIQVGEIRAERVLAENNIIGSIQQRDNTQDDRALLVDQVMSKLDEKLSNFYITVGNQNGNNINTTELESSLSKIETVIESLPNKEFINKCVNETIETILDTKSAVTKSSEIELYEIGHLREGISNMSSIERIFIQTSDSILELKRRVEYGVHQILLGVNDIVKENGNSLNSSIQRIDGTIMSNISVKIETEISQVWRQIGIMYQEISSSKQSLDKLQQQTELYVNGTVSTMESMQGKMSLVTGRMSEVDENLNYLLGRLSLVTQEFGQIKTGLSSALESIRSSFKAVQEQIQDAGPGPHNIQDDQQ